MATEVNKTAPHPENVDEESIEKKIPYPKSVIFIVSNEFCERFSYYGMRTILVIYLTNILLYSEDMATIIYHIFNMFVYFFPIFGAILSDSYLGKFRTILYVSIIYAVGSIVLALASAEPIGLPQKEFSILGLLLIALGTGGIKPCVSAFGGDQFILPQQAGQLITFFSFFYFAINAGSLISTFVTPVLRNDVHCFGQDSCFFLAFAIPGALMLLSIVIFAVGRPLYIVKNPEGNIVVEVSKCIGHAIVQKFKSKESKEHWLDHADDKFDKKLITNIKASLKVLVLYTPFPIFWALYDQQGSGWTFQAVRMDGTIGGYTILPDQMQLVNPLLILLFIPLFTYVVYPMLAKCNILKTPLQRMACGGFLAAVAFVVSALVSIALESTYPQLPTSGNVQLRVFNPSSCRVAFNAPAIFNVTSQTLNVESLDYYVNKDISFEGNKNISFSFTSNCTNLDNLSLEVPMAEANAYAIYFTDKGAKYYVDSVEKSEDGYPKVRTLAYNFSLPITYTKGSYNLSIEAGNSELKNAPYPGTYVIQNLNQEVTFKQGGTYAVMINEALTSGKSFNSVVITEPNTVHILWLIPQYVILTAAEIMFSITGLEFSYSQAPLSMKSLLQACWLLTTAIGNLIIVIISSLSIFEKKSNDFFLYAGLMVIDILLFTFMAMKYKYVVQDEEEVEDLQPSQDKKRNGLENQSFTQTVQDKQK